MTRKLAAATVIKPGPHSLLEDLGRCHNKQLGLPSGGAADIYAYHWANKLLDNLNTSAALEITLGPCILEFQEPTQIAICGARSEMTLVRTGQRHSMIPWSARKIKAGDRVNIGMASSGLRSYVAIAGGFKQPNILGSCEPLTADGRLQLLAEGDQLYYTPEAPVSKFNRSAHWHAIPDYHAELVLSLHPCYQYHHFSAEATARLFNATYRIEANSNRMGYRLRGPNIPWKHGGIISEGIAFGSVQIPPDGQPIVLLNDRQTIGGYPKVGCIHASDCYELSQRRPGQTVRFELVSL